MHRPTPSVILATALLAAVATGCSKSDAPAEPGAPAVSATAAPARTARAVPTEKRIFHNPPEGPILGIQAGKGIGAIFLGATVATIERQMNLPCDLNKDDVCRYFDRAVEFHMKDDKLVRILVERVDRPAGKDARGVERKYGVFHGAIPPDIKLGMLPWAVHQYLGQPLSVTKVTADNPNHTVSVEHYTGMDLEFDELGPERVVLGGVWVPGEPPK